MATMFDDEIKFVTGASLNSVATDIRRDLEWRRLSATRWEDEEGAVIHYLSDPAQLLRARKARIYLLPGFDERDDWWLLDDTMRARGHAFEVL